MGGSSLRLLPRPDLVPGTSPSLGMPRCRQPAQRHAGSHTWKALQILPAGEGSVGGHWGQQLTGGLDRSRQDIQSRTLRRQGSGGRVLGFSSCYSVEEVNTGAESGGTGPGLRDIS